MAGPSWLADAFAAIMIVTAVYSASRLAVSRLRGLATEADADGLHALMGTAMAGMLVPRLALLPASVWAVVFGVAGSWFAACAIRAQGARPARSARCRFPVPHMIECIAMLYMLLAARGAQGAGAMPGMGTSPASLGGFPALAVVLAMFMIGYVMWATDRLAALARARIAPAGRRRPGARPETRRLRQARHGHHHGLHAPRDDLGNQAGHALPHAPIDCARALTAPGR